MIIQTRSASSALPAMPPVQGTSIDPLNDQKAAFYSSMGKATAVALPFLATLGVGVASPLLGTVIVGGAATLLALFLFSSCGGGRSSGGHKPVTPSWTRGWGHFPTSTPPRHPYMPPPPHGPRLPPPPQQPHIPGGHYPVGGRRGMGDDPGSVDDGPHYPVGGRH